jgi:hypothetical protein
MTSPDHSESPQSKPRRLRRKLLTLGLLVLLPILAFVGSYAFVVISGNINLNDAIAETERLDGPWRLPDVDAKRAVIPDSENSSLQVTVAAQALPAKWPRWDHSFANIKDGEEAYLAAEGDRALSSSFSERKPPVQLNEVQITSLREELKRAQAALTIARKLADLPRGRYPVTFSADFIRTRNYGHVQGPRSIAELLKYDAVLRAQERDADGAIRSCLAALNAGRSFGDEPSYVSQLVRMNCAFVATHEIVGSLALGESSTDALTAAQRLLSEDAEEPLLLYATRGERASMDLYLDAVQAGEVGFSGVRTLLTGKPSSDQLLSKDNWETLCFMGSIRTHRAALLKRYTQLVEVGKLPGEIQTQKLNELKSGVKAEIRYSLLDLEYTMKAGCQLGLSMTRLCAYQRSAAVAMALERYRKDRGNWPGSLAGLVPKYLEKVPLDPFDGKPLRFGTFDKGVVIYSVGSDGVDNGGHVERDTIGEEGMDFGFRLWDVKHRRQPAKPFEKPKRSDLFEEPGGAGSD